MMRTTGASWFTPLLGCEAHPAVHDALRYVPFVVEPGTAPQDKKWFQDGAANVLAIGKFQPRKNHILFVDAVSDVARRHAVRALIVGECTKPEHRRVLAEVRRRCAELGLEDTVDIRTNLPFADVQALYPRYDLFVLASEGEPAAVSPLEAMAHSLPVISSDTNGTACYVVEGRTGFVCRSGDVRRLATCIAEAVGDRARLMAMGAASYRQALAVHDPARYVNALVDMAGGRA